MDGTSALPRAAAFPRHRVLGVEIDYVGASEAADAIVNWAKHGDGGYVCIPNAHVLIEAEDDPTYAAVLAGAKLRLPDSMVLQKVRSWLYRVPRPETLLGARLTHLIAGRAAAAGVRVGLIGATPETLEKMQAQLRADFPNLQIVHAFSPPFAPVQAQTAQAAAADARAAGCQIVFLGLGAPKQERWMALAAAAIPDAVMVGVGASFDAIAGVKPPAPPIFHRLGLEWLHRLLQEPERLGPRYLRTNPRFLIGVLAQKRAMMQHHDRAVR
jgi:N-acetylglucosaminyldiphosphoundecaprenol N-acetyl-beta-D-mannosaminyltransferase